MNGWSFLFAFPDQLAELKASNTQERFDSCHGKDLHAFWEQDMKTQSHSTCHNLRDCCTSHAPSLEISYLSCHAHELCIAGLQVSFDFEAEHILVILRA